MQTNEYAYKCDHYPEIDITWPLSIEGADYAVPCSNNVNKTYANN